VGEALVSPGQKQQEGTKDGMKEGGITFSIALSAASVSLCCILMFISRERATTLFSSSSRHLVSSFSASLKAEGREGGREGGSCETFVVLHLDVHKTGEGHDVVLF